MIDRQELKDNLNDFLNSFLGYHSEEYGNYYPKWSDFEAEIVDQDLKKCTNQSIYQKLKNVIGEYGFEFTDHMVLRLIDELR